MNTLIIAARLLGTLTVILGGLYPLLVWGVGQTFFADEAGGSLLRDTSGKVVGSALLAQKPAGPGQLHPRPSAAAWATLPSGASHLPWTSARLRDAVTAAAAEGRRGVTATASGSGLDPHLPVAEALSQLDRVGVARGWNSRSRSAAEGWIALHAEGGRIGPAYVNVLAFNLALDAFDAAGR